MSCLELKRNISHCVLITEPLILNSMKLKKFNQLDFFRECPFCLISLPSFLSFFSLSVGEKKYNQLVWVFLIVHFVLYPFRYIHFFAFCWCEEIQSTSCFFLNVHFVLCPFCLISLLLYAPLFAFCW